MGAQAWCHPVAGTKEIVPASVVLRATTQHANAINLIKSFATSKHGIISQAFSNDGKNWRLSPALQLSQFRSLVVPLDGINETQLLQAANS